MGPASPLRFVRDDKLCLSRHHSDMVGERIYFVYLLASKPYGTLYAGVTNDLVARVHQHREGEVPGFTKRHGIKRLAWFEEHRDVNEAIAREKKLKRWRRNWKIALIEEGNPHWEDLYLKLLRAGWRVER